jgi:hypothetical protein
MSVLNRGETVGRFNPHQASFFRPKPCELKIDSENQVAVRLTKQQAKFAVLASHSATASIQMEPGDEI